MASPWGDKSPFYEDPPTTLPVVATNPSVAQGTPEHRVLSTEALRNVDDQLEELQRQLETLDDEWRRSSSEHGARISRIAQALSGDVQQIRSNLQDEARQPKQTVLWSVE